MQEQSETLNPTQSQAVQGPPNGKTPKKGARWILIVVAVLLIAAGGTLFYIGSQKNREFEITASPTPQSAGVTITETPTPAKTPEPTSTPRDEISIEVLNGTGIPGEASYLQGILEDLGYEDITADNADEQDYESAEVTFASSVSDDRVKEIMDELEDVYDDVVKKSSESLTSVDVRIITGTRPGADDSSSTTTTSDDEEATSSASQ